LSDSASDSDGTVLIRNNVNTMASSPRPSPPEEERRVPETDFHSLFFWFNDLLALEWREPNRRVCFLWLDTPKNMAVRLIDDSSDDHGLNF
jgi:hypothetical protein